MIHKKTRHKTSLTPTEINLCLQQLEKKETVIFGHKRFKIRRDGSTFSIRAKHSGNENEGPMATAYGSYYRSGKLTKVDLITKPSIGALILAPLATITIPIFTLLFPEHFNTAEDIVLNTFEKSVLVGLFLLIMIPINYLVLIMPMHQIRYFIEKELKLEELL